MSDNRIVYLNPLKGTEAWESLMRFRLIYEGELRPSQRDARDGQLTPLAAHKQEIRKVFHRQLKRLWATNRFLRDHEVYPTDHVTGRSAPNDAIARGDMRHDSMLSLVDAVAGQYHEFGYHFVPLVREDISLLCSLDILFLRNDTPGSLIDAGDLDNRVKTLIDGLRRPRNATELVGYETPAPDEDPFFCLLEDDKVVTSLAVETDALLDQPDGSARADRSHVHLVITVDLKPYDVTMFNLSFA